MFARSLPVAAFLVLAMDRPLAIKPHPSVFRMANEARAVVEGTLQQGGVVVITRTHFQASGVTLGGSIRVPSLATMTRVPFASGEAPPPAIAPDVVLLFLADEAADGWRPLLLLGKAARGVLWFAQERAWGYAAILSDGDYELQRWRTRVDGTTVDATVDDVRAELARGLGARGAWQATLAVADPAERARGIARWFGASSSPDREFWHERLYPDLREAVAGNGGAMATPLGRVVAVADEPWAAEAAAQCLGDLGVAGRAGVPGCIARLRELRGVHPCHLLRALRSLADPRAIPVLCDLVEHEDAFVAADAARALHASGDAEAAMRLRARVPATVDGAPSIAALAELLDALHDLDPAGAAALATERFTTVEALWAERGWLRALRR